MKTMKISVLKALGIASVLAGLCLPVSSARAQDQTLTGEVVDLMCYLDHGAKGEKHAGCAKTCISKGGPVGLLTTDGTLYLVIGQHKPINDQLADVAAQTVTLKGKVVEKSGMKMIENAEIQK
jgi:hypothetical protein